MINEIIHVLQSSCIKISELIKTKNLLKLGSETENKNATDDAIKELDIQSNQILIDNLSKVSSVKYIASEEEENLLLNNKNGKYLVSFDPLDGSSNIDVNITIGTIFGIYDIDKDKKFKISCAGYSLYGSQTQFILAHKKVELYQLLNEKFVLIQDNLKIPNRGKIVSMNLSYNHINFNKKYELLAKQLFNKGYTLRFVGSMVADAHRTLLKGGIFMYPANKKSQEGKIRLLYEAIPFAFIFEIAGGIASNGYKRLLDVKYSEIHQRTPIILSSKYEFSKL
jgi:fructose-1,6-bisphosphatase I